MTSATRESSAAGPAADDSRVALVMEEYLNALEAGRRPRPEDFLARYPDLAPVLARALDGLEFIREAASQLREPVAGDPPAGGEGDGADALAGRPLGDFRIIRQVGRGGMGVVYEAEQMSLGRRVALKVLPFAATMDERHLQRFRNEAQAAARLHHTNIVPVFFVGSERGVHFYAMQLIEGQSLAAVIARLRAADRPAAAPPSATTADASSGRPLPGPAASTAPPAAGLTDAASTRDRAFFRTVARLGVQAAEALDHAHEHGVVHRDVKPGNLLVDGESRLWVTDFGLALAMGQAGLTMTGDVVGTLRYMSPEQALAKRAVVDHRTDIYSLGATLYELLTLEPAFPGSDRQELLRRIAFEEPRKPRARNKAIPAELETIVLKALEKNPAERYATAQELADDLECFLRDEPIRARRPTLVQRARKWARRHQAAVAAGLAFLVLAVVVLAGSTALIWRAWRETDAALQVAQANEAKAVTAADEESKARNAADLAAAAEKAANDTAQKRLAQIEKANTIIASVFQQLDPHAEEKGEPALRVQLGERLDEAAKLLEGDAVGDRRVVARLQNLLGRGLRQLGHYNKAQPLLEKARKELEEALGTDHLDTLASKFSLAELYLDQGKYERAEPLLQEVLQGFTAQRGPDHPDTLNCKNSLAALYQEQGKYKQAEAILQEILQRELEKPASDHPDTLGSKNNLAMLYIDQGKYGQAETLLREVLQACKDAKGADHPHTLTSKNNLAMLYSKQGNYDKAEALYLEALQGAKGNLGADHPATLGCKNNLAVLYQAVGKHDRAEQLFQEALQGCIAKLGADHPRTLTCKHGLAALYIRQRKYERAEPLCRDVVRGFTALWGDNHPSTLTAKNSLAELYKAEGKYAQAEPLARDVLQRLTAVLGPDHPRTLTSKYNLAGLYVNQGKYDQAEPLLRDAVEGAIKKPGLAHPFTQHCIGNLLDCYERMRAPAKAEPLLRRLADLARQQAGADSPPYAGQLAALGLNLLQQNKDPAETEKVLRECLAIREKQQPDAWATFNTRSLLGGALLSQQKYAEAEPLLLQGYEGMKQREATIPPPAKARVTEAVERLVRFYDARGQKDKADAWRQKLPPELLPPPVEGSPE
jgi:serine/threonine protein kinase/Tfp pilus assembly protein PilF